MTSTHPLRAFREASTPQISQEELGVLLGVTRAAVSRWESGERFPGREHRARIRDATGISFEELDRAADEIAQAKANVGTAEAFGDAA